MRYQPTCMTVTNCWNHNSFAMDCLSYRLLKSCDSHTHITWWTLWLEMKLGNTASLDVFTSSLFSYQGSPPPPPKEAPLSTSPPPPLSSRQMNAKSSVERSKVIVAYSPLFPTFHQSAWWHHYDDIIMTSLWQRGVFLLGWLHGLSMYLSPSVYEELLSLTSPPLSAHPSLSPLSPTISHSSHDITSSSSSSPTYHVLECNAHHSVAPITSPSPSEERVYDLPTEVINELPLKDTAPSQSRAYVEDTIYDDVVHWTEAVWTIVCA